MKNFSTRLSLENLGITLYADKNRIYLVEDECAIMAFIRKTSVSTNSMRISLFRDRSWTIAPNISSSLFSDLVPVTAEQLGYEMYEFLCIAYLNSREFMAKENPFSERVLFIQKRTVGVPYEVVKMLVQSGVDDKTIFEVVRDLRRMAPLTVMNNHEYANILMNGTKREKKNLIKQLIEPQSYTVLDLDNRGRHYTDVVANMLLCCYSAA